VEDFLPEMVEMILPLPDNLVDLPDGLVGQTGLLIVVEQDIQES
jgi:hypothetical protein